MESFVCVTVEQTDEKVVNLESYPPKSFHGEHLEHGHLMQVSVPYSQRLVLANCGEDPLLGMRRQSPDLARSVPLDQNPESAIPSHFQDLALPGAHQSVPSSPDVDCVYRRTVVS